MTLPQEIIRAKRDGRELTEAEIGEFIAGLTSGVVTEGQAAALAMAVFFNGMTLDERIALTRAMTLSGETLDWRAPDLPGPVLDKHSTGGVGDNVSLMLGPMLAACGAFVPMISGRGLGHTGGTLDKLDSIPGYATQPDLLAFKRVVREAGCAIIGQTEALAPADRRLYAIRDVTATVESVALITASILSKKLAAGLEGLVMDVKTGSGAFMPTLKGAHELAQSIAAVATGAGLPTVSLITDMNEPLASAAGNAVEVKSAVDFLIGRRRDARLHRVTLALGAEALSLAGLARDAEEGAMLMQRTLDSGAAAERFERMVAGLGGPRDFLAPARDPIAARARSRCRGPGARRRRDGHRRARDRPGGGRARRRTHTRVGRHRSFRRLDRAGAARGRGRAGQAACADSCAQRRRGRGGGAPPSGGLPHRRRGAGTRRSRSSRASRPRR